MNSRVWNYSVYRLTCQETGKAYVGVTRKHPEKRWQEHLYAAARGASTILHRAIRKHGFDSFYQEVLHTGTGTHEEMFAAEVAYISQCNTLVPRGYNLTRGGEGTSGHKMSAEGKARLSALHKGMKASPETRAKMSQTRKGRPFSEAAKLASSESQRDSKNHRYGKHNTEEWKAVLREKNSGAGNPFHGCHHSEESKIQIRQSLQARDFSGSHNPSARTVVAHGVTYSTMKDAMTGLNLKGYGALYRLLSDNNSGVSIVEKTQ